MIGFRIMMVPRGALVGAVVCAGVLSVIPPSVTPAGEQFSLGQCLRAKSGASEKTGCLKQQQAYEDRQREQQAGERRRQRQAEEDAARRQAEEAGRGAERARQAAAGASRLREARDAGAQRDGERGRREGEAARREAEEQAWRAVEHARRVREARQRAAEQFTTGSCAGPVPTRDCAMRGDPIAEQIRRSQEETARWYRAR